MGRMAAYTGEEITWDQMLKSHENLFPALVPLEVHSGLEGYLSQSVPLAMV